ncbi:MAG: hypothetical protein VW644_01585 [Alphaproteobacteria bacterium]
MLKNMLLASAAAFVVLGAAASLSNMKAVITSGSGADAALPRDAVDLQARLGTMRDEQMRQATLLSVQEAAIRQLQRDLALAGKVMPSDGVPSSKTTVSQSPSLGLDIPGFLRAEQAAAYHAAWRQAMASQNELATLQDAYSTLERETGTRLAALESETGERIAMLERDHRFTVGRLEAEIAQRDSSIVGLMHRIVSMQSGSKSATPAIAARPEATPSAAAVAPVEEKADVSPAPAERRSEAKQPATVEEAATAPAVARVMGRTVADGAAAYHAGDYDRAFEIWRVLANNGDARARFHLGALYYEGRGVARELETAHLLLGMAADAGHDGAAAMRDRVAAEIQQAQLAAAAPR